MTMTILLVFVLKYEKRGKSGALYAEVAPTASGAHTNVILEHSFRSKW